MDISSQCPRQMIAFGRLECSSRERERELMVSATNEHCQHLLVLYTTYIEVKLTPPLPLPVAYIANLLSIKLLTAKLMCQQGLKLLHMSSGACVCTELNC
eukprot:TRINITY_DN2654_c0_g1_i2.p2 TRINITY_DN2654_c0_g1~~TRINITY_DN2654_c0_g1_i2.p2  ORF type:complete len:100 (+),score=5.66 TRINITY_DN2654_c0_g1_i2:877-1176(+)